MKGTHSRASRCNCPIYCKICGRIRSRDADGHYCKTPNCEEQHGYKGCTYSSKKEGRQVD